VVKLSTDSNTFDFTIISDTEIVATFKELDLLNSGGSYVPGTYDVYLCHDGLYPDAICTNCVTLLSNPYINVVNFPYSPYTYLPTCLGGATYNVEGGNLPLGTSCQFYRYIQGNTYPGGTELQVDTYPTGFGSNCDQTYLYNTWDLTCSNCCYHMTLYYGWGNEGTSYTEVDNFFKVCADGSGCGQSTNYCGTC